ASIFVIPTPIVVESQGIFSAFFQQLFPDTVSMYIFSCVLLTLQATFLNIIVTRHRFTRDATLYAGLFYIIFSSCFVPFNTLSPLILANTFLILTLGEIFIVYKKTSCADSLFNIGFFVALGSLFYPAYLLFLILGFAGVVIMRAFKIREMLMVLFGVLAVYFLMFTYFYVTDNVWFLIEKQFLSIATFLDWHLLASNFDYVYIGFFILLILITLFSIGSYNSKQVIYIHKCLNVLYWTIICGVLTFLFQKNVSAQNLIVFAIPLGVFISFNFLYIKNKLFADIILVLLLIFALVMQYHTYFGF
ncbi:MAG: DUF6427 family protein, partial [Saprospiraceae bacterium]